jgi:ferrous-iron efflux pump FieF
MAPRIEYAPGGKEVNGAVRRTDWIVPTGGAEKSSTARLAIAVALGLAAVKGGAWLYTGSVAVLASAADSVMDVFASGVNFIAIRAADAPEDAQHRFGHGKAEGMAGLFQSLVIGGSAIYLVHESVARLLAGEPIVKPLVGVGVMVVSIVVTILLVARMRAVAKATDSLALKADSLHYFSDVLANLGVLVGLLVYEVTGVAWIDPIVSLLICGAILWSVAGVFKESFDNLMDRQLPRADRDRIREIVRREVPEIHGFHDMRTRRSGARRFIDIHVEIDRDLSFVEAHRIAEKVTRRVEAGLPNSRVLVHADPWPPDPEAYREPQPATRADAEEDD